MYKLDFFSKMIAFSIIYGIFIKFGIGPENVKDVGWFLVLMGYIIPVGILAAMDSQRY